MVTMRSACVPHLHHPDTYIRSRWHKLVNQPSSSNSNGSHADTQGSRMISLRKKRVNLESSVLQWNKPLTGSRQIAHSGIVSLAPQTAQTRCPGTAASLPHCTQRVVMPSLGRINQFLPDRSLMSTHQAYYDRFQAKAQESQAVCDQQPLTAQSVLRVVATGRESQNMRECVP
jgi:hypothetical protein